MKRALAISVPVAITVAALATLLVRTAPPARPPPPGTATYGDFTIQTSSGALSLSDLRGQVVVLYFGYTSCPDVCPTTMAALNAAFRRLPRDVRDGATVLMISVEPKRDDVKRLAEYVGFFSPSFRAGTTDPGTLAVIARDWGVSYRYREDEGSSLDYLVDHSTSSLLVGADGELIRTLPHGMHPQKIADAIRSAVERTR